MVHMPIFIHTHLAIGHGRWAATFAKICGLGLRAARSLEGSFVLLLALHARGLVVTVLATVFEQNTKTCLGRRWCDVAKRLNLRVRAVRSRFVLVGTPNARRAVVLDCTAIRLERRVTCWRRWWRGHLNWRSAESMFHRRIAVSCF